MCESMFLSDCWCMRIKRSLLYVVSMYAAAHTCIALLPALVCAVLLRRHGQRSPVRELGR